MAKGKDMAGKDKEPQVRGKSGPPSSTANEEKRSGKGKTRAGRVPKIGKHEAGKSDVSGGGLH